VNKNTTVYDRSGSITVYSIRQHGTSDELSKSFNVTQAKYKFDSTPLSFSIGALNEQNTSFDFDMVCSGNWSANDIPYWLTVSPNSGKGGTIKVSLRPANNTEQNARTANVRFVSSDNNYLTKTVTITQQAFIFQTDITSKTVDSAASSFNCTVKCTAGWKVSTNQSWLKVDKTTGNKNGTFKVTVDRNTSKSQRKGEITVTSDYGNLKSTITVTQKGS
jgi:hypothetical protein